MVTTSYFSNTVLSYEKILYSDDVILSKDNFPALFLQETFLFENFCMECFYTKQ